jgi:hypothetical protein
MRFIVGNNGTAANLASCTRCCGNGYKGRNVIGDKNIPTNEVIVFE